MSDCVCFKNYQCLSCERKENKKQAVVKTRRTIRKIAECGTRAGYGRHLNFKEPTCQPCRDAQKAGVQRWQRENKAS